MCTLPFSKQARQELEDTSSNTYPSLGHNGSHDAGAHGLSNVPYFTASQEKPLTPSEKYEITFRYNASREPAKHAESIEAAIYPGMVKVSVKTGERACNQDGDFTALDHSGAAAAARRGLVSTFTRKSRKRMIDFMNMLRGLVAGFFVTLTYPNNFPTDSARWRRDIDALSKRFLREYPQAGAVWRKEFKRRKSGSNKGQIAPHFHLLVIGVADLDAFREWLAVAWFEVVASGDEQHRKAGTQAAKIESRRHAMHYVSKYLAKCDDDILTDDSGQPIPVGRWWGHFGTLDNIPSMTVHLTYQQLVALRRVAAALQRVRSRRVAKIIKRGKLGFAVWGAGDETDGITDLFDSLGFRLLQASGL